jgi:SM-20-related protein
VLDQIVQEIQQQGFCFVPEVLSTQELALVAQFFSEHRQSFRPAMVGTNEARHRQSNIRGDFTLWMDPLENVPEFSRIMQFLNDLKHQLNTQCYLGLQQFECHLAYYPPGSFYKKHLDRIEGTSSRTLSFIFYLHSDWERSNGGELAIYHKEGGLLKMIDPLPGSFVCFLSEDFPHEVKSGNIERRSLSGWMHTKTLY